MSKIIRVIDAGAFGQTGAQKFLTQAGGTQILPGQPVVVTLGAPYAAAAATGTPVVGTDYMVGFATTASTETASADGVVWVQPLVPGVIYGGAPLAPTSWDTQAEYDALVGNRVLFNLSSGDYTITATDGANNGLVVQAINIKEFPSTVAFSVRNGVSYLA